MELLPKWKENENNEYEVFMCQRGIITIPAPLRKLLSLDDNASIVVRLEDDKLVLIPKKE